MKTIIMDLQQPYFDQIVSNEKIYECRAFDDKRKQLNLLDVIEFTNKEQSHKVFITSLAIYNSFHDALLDRGFENIVPSENNIEDGVKVYHDIPGYIEKEEKYGVVLIGFKKYSNDI